MKKIYFILVVTIAGAGLQPAKGQPVLNEPDYSKPALFADIPDSASVEAGTLNYLFSKAKESSGNFFQFSIAPGFSFAGIVVSSFSADDSASSSVVIKLLNKAGSSFTLTRIKDATGNYTFLGRIISFQHIDSFELVKRNGAYTLKKRNFYDLVNE